MWNHLNNINVLVNKWKTHLFYYVYGADLMYLSQINHFESESLILESL